MTLETTSTLTGSLRGRYKDTYMEAGKRQRVYDQIAIPVPGLSMDEAARGTSVTVPFLSGMTPGTTTISQVADVTPQILVDATAQVSPTSRWGALQWSELLDIQVYTDYAQQRMEKLGEDQVITVEQLAIDVALAGAWVERVGDRGDLDAGTASHRASDSVFRKMQAQMLAMRVPGFINESGEANTWAAILTPFPFHDICESGNVDAIGLYQNQGIHLNWELGQIGSFRLVVSPFAKTFFGAGAANASDSSTTLNGAVARLATSVVTTANKASESASGLFLNIGTEETAGTFYADNEQVKLSSAATTTLTIIGSSENEGLRYAHDDLTAINNNDSVYTIVFGGPASLVKLFVPSIGEFGEVVGPKESGILDQFASVGWKFYGNYGLLTENRIVRGEYSTSYEA